MDKGSVMAWVDRLMGTQRGDLHPRRRVGAPPNTGQADALRQINEVREDVMALDTRLEAAEATVAQLLQSSGRLPLNGDQA